MQRLLARFGERGMIIGGVAASLLGRPRLTADVDVIMLLSVEELPELIAAAEEEGLTPRIQDAEDFARHHYVLLLRHRNSGIPVDISLGMLSFEKEAVERSIVYQAGELTLRLPTPEDLIIFKAVAHRPQDLLDIQALVKAHPNLDRERIERWVREFARALDMPDLWENIAGWLRET
ncbi:MAG: hypothetical protein J7452_05590 [Thermoflexus sp.]|nr:hypothetical protein [Thermoflexus sp.]